MKTFSATLLTELEMHLKLLSGQNEDPALFAEDAVTLLLDGIEKLKAFFIKYKCRDALEEICFFREIKPQFSSRLIYYNEIYRITTGKPFGPKKAQRKYLEAEINKLKAFFIENLEFYKYYRTGSRYLDEAYFLRGKHDVKLSLDSYYLQADSRFSTSHDYKVSRILANEMLNGWLAGEIAKLETGYAVPQNRTQKWTGSKVALIELIYALHAEGVFNHGNAELKEVASLFESAFNVELGQYHRTFLEIRGRKSERAKFLCGLRERLLGRMEEADQ